MLHTDPCRAVWGALFLPLELDELLDTHLQVSVAQKVTTGVYKGVTTSELDELAAETAASMTATHPDYAVVSSSLAHASSKLSLEEEWAPRGWGRVMSRGRAV